MSLPLLGQRHFIGLQGGVNLAKIAGIESEFRYGVQTGLNYQYALNDTYIYGVDFLLIQRGMSQRLIHVDAQGNDTGIRLVGNLETDYISIPLKGGVVVGNKLSGIFNLGLVPSFLIDAKYRQLAYEGISDEMITEHSGYPQFDLGGLIEIGANYTLSSSTIFFVSARLFKSIPRYDSWIQHCGIEFSAGTRVALK